MRGERFEATLGWDRPMRTYFAMVYDRATGPADDEELLWIGNRYDELPTIDALEERLRAAGALALDAFPEAELGDELRAALEADRAREGGRPAGHFTERFVRSVFGEEA